MKKISSSITPVVSALLLCFIFFQYSCNRDHTDCSSCGLTQQEQAPVSSYNVGNTVVFKNDTTGAFDTLHVIKKDGWLTGCSYPCNNLQEGFNVFFNFSHLAGCEVYVAHSSTPYISVVGAISNFVLSGSVQTMTINSASYNDVYLPSIDSTKIANASRDSIPWKIAYSKSKGFIRFYMVKGQTWSKY